MGNLNLSSDNGKSLLQKGLDIMNDPNSSVQAKVGSIAVIGVGAITAITLYAINKIMGGGR